LNNLNKLYAVGKHDIIELIEHCVFKEIHKVKRFLVIILWK
jgi:hypothetical protein